MEDERIKLLERTVALLEILQKEGSKDIEIKKGIESINAVFSPDYSRVPEDLRKAVGIAFGTAVAESDLPVCAQFTRKTLSLLRTAIIRARGPKQQIENVEKLMHMIDKEIHNCEHSETPVFDRLWNVTNKSLGYISDRVFEGYGAFTSNGFGFNKTTPNFNKGDKV